jgi:CDP-diacylglycerol--glycerol-3-phosphate 3-phosphatidyltransferase
MFNLPNSLSLARIATIPFIVVLLYYPSRITCLLAMLVFMLASLTDLVDGFIARRWNIVTTVGKFLDPLADKLLIGAILIMLVHLGWIEAWICIIIISREMAVTGLRAIAADYGMIIAADSFGKLKTILQIAALCPLTLHYPWFGLDPKPIGMACLYAALVLTVFSGGKYFYGFSRNWISKETT